MKASFIEYEFVQEQMNAFYRGVNKETTRQVIKTFEDASLHDYFKIKTTDHQRNLPVFLLVYFFLSDVFKD